MGSRLFPERTLPAFNDQLDWERVAHLLSGYRLSAHFLSLLTVRQMRVDAAFLDELKRDRYSAMFYGDQCALYVRQLLKALEAAKIPVIVLKGWSFIPRFYGDDHSQRLCEDIDLLVRPQDVDAVEVVLQQLKFVLEAESWRGYNRRYWNGARYFAPIPAGMPAENFSLGLHWGLWHTPSYDAALIDIDLLFGRALPLNVAGVSVLRLAAEDEIVYLAAHTALHHFFDDELFRYYELAAVILEADDLDWDTVFERARAWDVLLALQHVLGKVAALWEGVLPPGVLEQLTLLPISRRERFTMRWLQVTRANSALMHLLYWLTFPIWWQRGLIVLQDIFPGSTYMKYRYGKAPWGLWVLLYFRRFKYAIKYLFR